MNAAQSEFYIGRFIWYFFVSLTPQYIFIYWEPILSGAGKGALLDLQLSFPFWSFSILTLFLSSHFECNNGSLNNL